MGLQGEGVLLGESGAPTTSGDPDFGDVFHRQEFFMHAMTDVPLTLTAMQPGSSRVVFRAPGPHLPQALDGAWSCCVVAGLAICVHSRSASMPGKSVLVPLSPLEGERFLVLPARGSHMLRPLG